MEPSALGAELDRLLKSHPAEHAVPVGVDVLREAIDICEELQQASAGCTARALGGGARAPRGRALRTLA
jgi:hypothetical protein